LQNAIVASLVPHQNFAARIDQQDVVKYAGTAWGLIIRKHANSQLY
jgi:hypothetical protein